jgi:hypothetical protein
VAGHATIRLQHAADIGWNRHRAAGRRWLRSGSTGSTGSTGRRSAARGWGSVGRGRTRGWRRLWRLSGPTRGHPASRSRRRARRWRRGGTWRGRSRWSGSRLGPGLATRGSERDEDRRQQGAESGARVRQSRGSVRPSHRARLIFRHAINPSFRLGAVVMGRQRNVKSASKIAGSTLTANKSRRVQLSSAHLDRSARRAPIRCS